MNDFVACAERKKSAAKRLRIVSWVDQKRKLFFLWLNPTRMHVVTHLSDNNGGIATWENEWTIQEVRFAS